MVTQPLEKLEEKKTGLEKKLPLVIEIKPGQATIGIMHLFEPGTYEGKSIKELAAIVLSQEVSVEEAEIKKSILENLKVGKLLYMNKEIEGDPLKYAREETTEAGQKYLYIELRAQKPLEGGI
jgi:hypothetical protein